MRWRATYSPIGLDLGSAQAKLVQLRWQRQESALHHAAVLPLSWEEAGEVAPERVVPVLRSALAAGRFVGRRVVSVLPASHVEVRVLRLALPEDPQAIREAVCREAAAYLPYRLEEAVLDYVLYDQDAQGEEGQRRVLVVAALRQHVEAHLALLQAAGLDCLALDVQPLALQRLLVQHQGLATASPVLVVEIGSRLSTACVLWQAALQYSRTFPWGGVCLTQAVMKGLGLEAEKAERLVRQHGVQPPAGAPERVPALAEVFWELVRPPLEAFAQELDRLVAFWGAHFRGAVIERVLLGGGGAALAGLEAYLQQRLGLPVGVVDPCAGLTLHETPPEESRPALAVATGLALRGGATRA